MSDGTAGLVPVPITWSRFWCPREGRLSLLDGGYLTDPTAEWGQLDNPDVVPFAAIADSPCLVLLGEPGIGKTHALMAARDTLATELAGGPDAVLHLDLRSYGSEDRLVRNLFDGPVFQAWANGAHRLTLFLDSLDECLLRIDTVAALLADELPSYPVERLSLRIACRTAEWPGMLLEPAFRRLWPDGVGVYELAPLRRADVIVAANAHGIDAEDFLREVHRRGAVPLAIKPLTLNLLLNRYRESGTLPATQIGLFAEGCRLLCQEMNPSRRVAGRPGRLSPEQRLTVAARIAAVTIFANRGAIWTAPEWGDVPPDDVPVRELVGGREIVGEDFFAVDQDAITGTLQTGLFSARGPDRLGWAHQSYAEFLAARYLATHDMAEAQRLGLLLQADDAAGRVVPQLRETAAWLAGMDPRVFRTILEAEPALLLQSDVTTADPPTRERLVAALLAARSSGALSRTGEIVGRLLVLAHPGLASQLQPYLRDRTAAPPTRLLAIDVATACAVRELAADLADLALDDAEFAGLRVAAAEALAEVGGETDKARLVPMATGTIGPDPDDELKGAGLQVVWPAGLLTAQQLFDALAAPPGDDFFGAYRRFLRGDPLRHLRPADLPIALRWVAAQPALGVLSGTWARLLAAVMRQGLEHLDEPGVLDAFAAAALARLRVDGELVDGHVDDDFDRSLTSAPERRRLVVEALIPMIAGSERDIGRLAFSHSPLVDRADLRWLIDRYFAAASPLAQQTWLGLIKRVASPNDVDHLDALLAARERDPSSGLAAAFADLRDAIELDSPEAERQRAAYAERRRLMRPDREPPTGESDPAGRVALVLDLIERGMVGAWVGVTQQLTIAPGDTHFRITFESNLTALPGWEAADATVQARIIAAARQFVGRFAPHSYAYLDEASWDDVVIAGYKALELLLTVDPTGLDALSDDVWIRWAPVVLAYPIMDGAGEEEPNRRLAARAYRRVPAALLECIGRVIDAEDRRDSATSVTNRFADCWDDQIAGAVLARLQSGQVRQRGTCQLLATLLDRAYAPARDYAATLVTGPPPMADRRAREVAVATSCVLLHHAADAGWPIVWPAMQADMAFGRRVAAMVAHNTIRQGAEVLPRLDEGALAALYTWLARQFPPALDPPFGGPRSFGARDHIALWRDAALQQLAERGTEAALVALRRLAADLPDLAGPRVAMAAAEERWRRATWVPATPAAILALAADRSKRLVASGAQLLDVLVESLGRLQALLQGETAAVIDLWNEWPAGREKVFRPADEVRLSDYVKRHLDVDLRARGIVANREVELRRGVGGAPGERTDIHVDAIRRGRGDGDVGDTITAVIEVKGSWHRELHEALESQLVSRYLRDSGVRDGLYLVGWFNCPLWEPNDGRRAQAERNGTSLDEVRQRLEEQATSLSTVPAIQVRAMVLDTALR